MNEVRLSGEEWMNPDRFWDDLLAAIGAPAWHGRNLDALADSIGGGSINTIEAPLQIVIGDVDNLAQSVVFLLYRIKEVLEQLQSEGTRVELVFPEGYPRGWDYVSSRGSFRNLRVLDILREWDPIGVYGPGSNWPDDEYDSYAGRVIALLKDGASTREIAGHLSKCAELSMGLTNTDPRKHESTAEHLLNMWSSGRR